MNAPGWLQRRGSKQMARLCNANCNGCVVSPMGVEVVGSVCRVPRIKAVVVLFGGRVFARVLGAMCCEPRLRVRGLLAFHIRVLPLRLLKQMSANVRPHTYRKRPVQVVRCNASNRLSLSESTATGSVQSHPVPYR